MLTFRYASKEDYVSIESIMKQVQQVHIDIRPDIYRLIDPVLEQAMFDKMIQQRSCIICMDEGEMAGVVVYMIQEVHIPVKHERKIMYIDALCVDDSQRRKGTATAMMNHMRKLSIQNQSTSIELHVNARNQGAIEFYRTYGFSIQTLAMEIPTDIRK